MITNVAVGFDNIDLDAAAKKGIAVTNTPDVLTQSVAEFVFAHILGQSRRVIESDKYIREGGFTNWSMNLMLGGELKGKTIGVIGFGKIGQTLVSIAKGFGMNVVYNNRSGELDTYEGTSGVAYATVNELLASSHYVVLLTPLTDETRYLIQAEELKKMKSSAVLINMARGPVVKESDLVQALKQGEIAGAGLDVFEFEPAVSEELKRMDNVVLTPHIGSATHEARLRMVTCAATNAKQVLEGMDCLHVVNKELLESYGN